MTANKDFKRLVRRRMLRTGESYTAARAKLVRKSPAKIDYAKLAGMSDAVIKAKTGCTWERWTHALDYVGAHAWPHRRIAEYVHSTFKVPDDGAMPGFGRNGCLTSSACARRHRRSTCGSSGPIPR
jgi:hypothetical protein